jgi:hypothetical protein
MQGRQPNIEGTWSAVDNMSYARQQPTPSSDERTAAGGVSENHSEEDAQDMFDHESQSQGSGLPGNARDRSWGNTTTSSMEGLSLEGLQQPLNEERRFVPPTSLYVQQQNIATTWRTPKVPYFNPNVQSFSAAAAGGWSTNVNRNQPGTPDPRGLRMVFPIQSEPRPAAFPIQSEPRPVVSNPARSFQHQQHAQVAGLSQEQLEVLKREHPDWF